VGRDAEAWIPIAQAESLNVAAAGAIALYEWARQNRPG
jgi:tRNA G18 (ribose-2'-O)-methylase SpoU